MDPEKLHVKVGIDKGVENRCNLVYISFAYWKR